MFIIMIIVATLVAHTEKLIKKSVYARRELFPETLSLSRAAHAHNSAHSILPPDKDIRAKRKNTRTARTYIVVRPHRPHAVRVRCKESVTDLGRREKEARAAYVNCRSTCRWGGSASLGSPSSFPFLAYIGDISNCPRPPKIKN